MCRFLWFSLKAEWVGGWVGQDNCSIFVDRQQSQISHSPISPQSAHQEGSLSLKRKARGEQLHYVVILSRLGGNIGGLGLVAAQEATCRSVPGRQVGGKVGETKLKCRQVGREGEDAQLALQAGSRRGAQLQALLPDCLHVLQPVPVHGQRLPGPFVSSP